MDNLLEVLEREDEPNTCPECERDLEPDAIECPGCTAGDHQDEDKKAEGW